MPAAAHDRRPLDELRPLVPSGRVTTPDGVGVAYYDLGGTGPPLVLAHATGFCAATLAPVARRLADAFRCIALDQRGHGSSDPPAGGSFDWHGFATDVLVLIDHLGLEHPLGVGHSCGGAALLLAEEARPGTFAGLYCFEPVVYPGDVPLAPDGDNPLSVGARRRRASFASRGDALANFSGKTPFDRLDPEVLALYVDNGFAPDTGGTITLRCRPEHESEVYAHALSHDAFARLGAVRCPVTLACGSDTDAFGVEFLSHCAARLDHPTTAVAAGIGHFGPLEDPALVASSVRRALIPRADTPPA
ncbi:MAG TPA: alpha/beta hydrolase [Acidimicrobiales bacterium]|nr:alpha/beta hydrolase [Acidimicrobiales bacterium]